MILIDVLISVWIAGCAAALTVGALTARRRP